MRIEDAETQKYKKLCKYVNLYVPIFKRYIPGRYKKYLEFAGDDAKGEEGVARAKGPSLKVRKTETILPSGRRANGFFWSVYPNDLYFDVTCAKKFEDDPSLYEIGLQYLVMHELIHWVRHHSGLPRTVPQRAGLRPGEAGDEFEFAAYGRDMSHVWDTGAAKFDRGTIKL